MKNNLLKAFALFKRNRTEFYKIIKAVLKGTFYIIFYKVTKKKVKIEFPFFAFATFRILGEGKVCIKRNCSSRWNAFRGSTIVTLSPDAEVFIEEGCDLGGCTIRCYKKIEIGARTQTAISLVQDTLFINQNECPSRISNHHLYSDKGIRIGRNVWLCAKSVILSGANIGDQCVLSSGSLCLDANLNSYHLAVGSPIFKSIRIDFLLNLLGKK